MPYKITRFGDIVLPHRMSTDDLSTGSVEGTLVQSLGGVYDMSGDDRRLPRLRFMRHKGMYAGSDAADLETQIDALKGAVGMVDSLWRQRHDGVDQWSRARLLSVQHEVEVAQHFGLVADVTASFEMTGAFWNAETATTETATLANGATSVLIDNDGAEAVRDAVVSVTAAATLASVDLVLDDAHLIYGGSLAAGDELVIDCGQQTVRVDGVDAYANFSLSANHAIDGWLAIPAGSSDLVVTTNGSGAVEVEFYTQYG